jgi:hypothetical protein
MLFSREWKIWIIFGHSNDMNRDSFGEIYFAVSLGFWKFVDTGAN